MHLVDRVHAVVLTGGSAFGLDVASGVTSYLEELKIGFQVGNAVVPIVSAAVLFDLGLITPEVRPGAAEGRAACLAASVEPMAEGTVGAGTGATVAKAHGIAGAVKSGIGSAALRLPEGCTVAAAVGGQRLRGYIRSPLGPIGRWTKTQGRLGNRRSGRACIEPRGRRRRINPGQHLHWCCGHRRSHQPGRRQLLSDGQP